MAEREVPAEPLRVSILTQGSYLIASIHTALDDGQLVRFQRDLIERIGAQRSRGVIIDVAALDVLEGEEGIFYADCRGGPIESRPLLRLHALANVLISPHTAYYTDHALRDTVECSLTNCLKFERKDQHG